MLHQLHSLRICVGARELPVTAGIGIAVSKGGALTAQELLAAADKKLYDDKRTCADQTATRAAHRSTRQAISKS